MVIQREMLPGEAYKQMSYAHKEKESYCNDNFCVNQTSSSMQMVRPSPCMPNTHHHVAGIHHDSHHLIPGKAYETHQHGHKDHQYCIKENCCDERRHHEWSHHGKEKSHHTNARVSEFVKHEAIKFCSDKLQSGGHGGGETHHHHASRPVVAEPYYYKQETTKYSGGPNGRVHYVEYKGLED